MLRQRQERVLISIRGLSCLHGWTENFGRVDETKEDASWKFVAFLVWWEAIPYFQLVLLPPLVACCYVHAVEQALVFCCLYQNLFGFEYDWTLTWQSNWIILWISRESEYAAWTLVNGYTLNHVTIATHRLKSQLRTIGSLNQFIEENGFKLNSEGGVLKGGWKTILLFSCWNVGFFSSWLSLKPMFTQDDCFLLNGIRSHNTCVQYTF